MRGSSLANTSEAYRWSFLTGRGYGIDVRNHWFKAASIGTVAGFMSGLLGIGGGVIIVPGLVLLVGMSQRAAAATSVATIAGTSAAALFALSGSNSVNWATAAVVFAGAAVGAYGGARFIDRIPEHWLAGVFAAIMGVAALRMWL